MSAVLVDRKVQNGLVSVLNCGQWNTFKEIRIAADTGSQAARNAATTLRKAASGGATSALTNKPQRLRDVSSHDDPRIDMHDNELNRVLGGGLVPGSIVLLGGEPGYWVRVH